MKISESILAVGSIAIDSLQTPNGNKNNVLGGSAMYFSLAAGLLSSVKLVGVVGDDFPEEGWDLLKKRNINIEDVLCKSGKTFRWGGRYNDDYSKRETLFTDLGVFESFSPTINLVGLGSPLIFLGNIHPELQIQVARLAKNTKYIISDTMNLWIDQCPALLEDVVKLSNIFLINNEEAYQFTGISDIALSAKSLLSLGLDAVIIKMGGNGSFLATKDLEEHVPCYPVEKLIDPTGAGDSFAGGFVGNLALNLSKPDLVSSAVVGSAMASFCVEGFGAKTLLEVTSERLNSRVDMIKQKN